MQRYLNTDGDSNVESYEIGPDYIRVKFFKTAKTYQYSYRKAGTENVETMKLLAQRGNGLNAFIKRNVNNLFD